MFVLNHIKMVQPFCMVLKGLQPLLHHRLPPDGIRLPPDGVGLLLQSEPPRFVPYLHRTKSALEVACQGTLNIQTSVFLMLLVWLAKPQLNLCAPKLACCFDYSRCIIPFRHCSKCLKTFHIQSSRKSAFWFVRS